MSDGNAFVKGRTNNHLTWVMVDETDFATPESALSAATKIKIYGKLRGQAANNFVSSGTGSLTNDIQHVGPSVTGKYTIACVKADLSDASAAWYDQYIIDLSAAGAARQVLIVDGGIDTSKLLAMADYLSNMASNLSAVVSDAYSAVILVQSGASDAASAAQQANSRILLVQSRLSDLDSRLVSDISDVISAANVGNSRILLVQSRLSDLDSRLVSDVSDILSAVRGNSDAISHVRSALLLLQSSVSDVDSAVSSQFSDLASKIGAITVAVDPSAISDIVSAMRVNLASDLSDILSAARGNRSAILLLQSSVSDVDSAVSSQFSDLASKIGAITVNLGPSDLSDIASAVVAALPVTSTLSDIQSYLAAMSGMLSDVQSAVAVGNSRALVVQSAASDAASAAQQGNSRVLLVQSRLSDLDSRLVSDVSDILSAVRGNSDAISHVRSALALLASSVSDVQSAVAIGNSRVLVVQSAASDAASAAAQGSSRAAQGSSRVLLVQSRLSDLDSRLVSDVSDIRSMLTALSDMVSNVDSAVSSQFSDLRSTLDAVGTLAAAAATAATTGASRALLVQSRLSDLDSRLVSDVSDIRSMLTGLSASLSDLDSAASSQFSDLASRVGAITVVIGPSDLSDLASAVAAAVIEAGAGGGTAGPGAIAWPYTLTDSSNSQPIADAEIWVSTDQAGENVIASGRTDQYGAVTFMLDAGVVYVWRSKTGFNFANPDTEVVS